MIRLVLFGAPGAGKGTQADLIEEKYGYKKISAGDLIRAEVKAESEVGVKVKEIVARGDLVPDGIIIDLIKARVARDDVRNGYIMDGFPRTIEQARELSKIAVDQELCIMLQVDEAAVVERLLSRWTCKNCQAIFNEQNKKPARAGVCDECGGELYRRSDDNAESISKRIAVYNRETLPVINYYREKEILSEVESSGSISDVFARIEEVLG